jgi:hypothetical protein
MPRAAERSRCDGADQRPPDPIREADIIVGMEKYPAATVREVMHPEGKTIHVLDIEDIYESFTPRLVVVLIAKTGALLPDVSRAMAGETE